MFLYDVSEVEVLEDDMVAYKAMNKMSSVGAVSLTLPEWRVPQKKDDGDFYPVPLGTIKRYLRGEVAESSFDTTPGLYCFALKEKAFLEMEMYRDRLRNWPLQKFRVYEILIPKGTKIKWASTEEKGYVSTILLVEALIPGAELEEE